MLALLYKPQERLLSPLWNWRVLNRIQLVEDKKGRLCYKLSTTLPPSCRHLIPQGTAFHEGRTVYFVFSNLHPGSSLELLRKCVEWMTVFIRMNDLKTNVFRVHNLSSLYVSFVIIGRVLVREEYKMDT